MSHWRNITRALYAAGGGPLRRDAFAMTRDGQDPGHALKTAARLGVMKSERHKYTWVWTITPKGIDMVEGRLVIKTHKPMSQGGKNLLAPTWCSGLAEFGMQSRVSQ